MAGMPLNHLAWMTKEIDAVYLGKWKDPVGAEALFFLDPATGRAIGPLNLRLAKADPQWEVAAPSVGTAPSLEPGVCGKVEFHYIGLIGPGPPSPPEGVQGTFAAFRAAPAHTAPLSLAQILESSHDPLAKALLLAKVAGPESAKARSELDALTDDGEIARALEGFRISGNSGDALRTLEVKIKKDGKWRGDPDFAAHRYLIPLAVEGLAGLARAEPCEPSDDQACHWLAGLVGPAKSWAEGRKDSVPREIEESLLRYCFSGPALFRVSRPVEGVLEPLDGPFLFGDDFSVPLLRAIAPEFFRCFRSVTQNRYTIPSCLFQSVSSKDRKTYVTLKFGDSGPERDFLWNENEQPAIHPGTRIGVLIQEGNPGAVVRHRICAL